MQEIKNMIHARLGGLGMGRETWVDILPAVLNQYNSRVHGTTRMTPEEVRKDKTV